jgi:hypothetical protein
VPQPDAAVLAFSRGDDVLALFNFAARDAATLINANGAWRDVLTKATFTAPGPVLPPYGMAWLIRETA